MILDNAISGVEKRMWAQLVQSQITTKSNNLLAKELRNKFLQGSPETSMRCFINNVATHYRGFFIQKTLIGFSYFLILLRIFFQHSGSK